MENASGIKVWHCLREISDIAVQVRISELETEEENQPLSSLSVPEIHDLDPSEPDKMRIAAKAI